jgi:hypothetical protein
MGSNSFDISRRPPSTSCSLFKRNGTKLPYLTGMPLLYTLNKALVLSSSCLPDKVGLHQKGVNKKLYFLKK